jgi:hypothetical protein
MNSSVEPSFRKAFAELPEEIQELARKNFQLWRNNPRHPSLHFKKIRHYWCVRVGRDFRALATMQGDTVSWFWIGRSYEKIIAQ